MAITAIEIKRSLIKMGFNVTDIVSNYDDALKSIQYKRPNVMLIDIGLKNEKDGIDLAITIQEIDTIPFIYLTSDNSEETIARAAQTNPSAYLSKPFRREELKSNLLIALHKTTIQNILKAVGNGYFYDNITKNIYHLDTPIHLSYNEKLLLEILINGRNSIVPFNIIEEHIWGINSPVAENSQRSLIHRLRSKLKDLPIETIPSFGYRLVIEN